MSEVRDMLGFSDPDDGAELLTAPARSVPSAPPGVSPAIATAAAKPATKTPPQLLAGRLEEETAETLDGLLDEIRDAVEHATDLADLRTRLLAIQPDMALDELETA